MRKLKAVLFMSLMVPVLEFAGCDLFSGGPVGKGGAGGATAPAAPTGFAVSNPAPASLTLSWNSSAGAASYQVYRDTTPAGSSAMLVYNNNGTGFADSGLASSSIYYYWIQATNSYGSSTLPPAPMASGTTLAAQAGAPAVPTGLAVSAAAPILTISWSSIAGATYLLYRDVSATGQFTTQVYGGSSTTFTDIPTPSGGTFYYEVQATNADGSSLKSSPTSGTQALGTNSFQPLFGACVYATNDVANYGSPGGNFIWNSISGSTLSLNGTIESLISKLSGSTVGDIGIIFDYWVDTYSQPNFWMFNVDYTSPTGYYTVYRYIGGSPAVGFSPIVNYTQNANVATYAGAINDLKVTYSFASPNYILTFYINGTQVYQWSGGSALHGGTSTTGFMAEVMNASYGENFPTVPVIDEFVQVSPTSFAGLMIAGPSGSRANLQIVPPSLGRSIVAPARKLFPFQQ